VIDIVCTAEAQEPAAEVVPTTAPVIAYYFHSNTRCTTCRTIESGARTALDDDIRAGRVAWRVVNFQLPQNAHLARKYDLMFATVVLVKPSGWKSLDRVWDHTDNPQAMAAYVKKELAEFRGDRP
jgi:hypothetical protein